MKSSTRAASKRRLQPQSAESQAPDSCAQRDTLKASEALHPVCPGCNSRGRLVPTITVKNLARDHTQVDAEATYSFCATATCDIVYFARAQVLLRTEIKVRVGAKESIDPIPLCYCFDYDLQTLCHAVATNRDALLLDRIKAEVQRGFCACNVKNPSGQCCLGDLHRARNQLRQEQR